jgi:hypothetical protein
MANENVHRTEVPCDLRKDTHILARRKALRRLAVPWQINGIADESRRGESFAETKERFFGSGDTMSKEREGVRGRIPGGKAQRRRLPSQDNMRESDVGFDLARKENTQYQAGG